MEENQVSEQKQPPFLIYAVVVVVILAAVVWLVLIPEQKEPQPQVVNTPVIEEPATVELEPQVPELETNDYNTSNVEEPVQDESIETVTIAEPEVEQVILDDNWLMTQLVEMVPNEALIQLVQQQDLISNFVVFVDNASRGELVTQFSPLAAPAQMFTAEQVEGDLLSYNLNSAVFARYDKYASLFNALSLEKSLSIYKDLTPAIDEAHMELGYEAGTFDRKLKRALDFLIDAPVLTDDVKLVAPSAMFKFADPELEGLLAIQKLLLRMGPENQQQIRAKLVEIREVL